jgi:hypothetical protein
MILKIYLDGWSTFRNGTSRKDHVSCNGLRNAAIPATLPSQLNSTH